MIATVTIRKLLGKPGKQYGFGTTADGSIVYIPGRLVPRLTVGEQYQAKLKPSNNAKANWFMADLVDQDDTKHKNRSRGLIIYEANRWNIVPRSNHVTTNL